MDSEIRQKLDPSAWVVRFAPLVRESADVLDLACGSGRHSRLFLSRGNSVCAVDNNEERLEALHDAPGLTKLCVDLENDPWPFEGRTFTCVVVTNYLCRALMRKIIASVAEKGVLIYETFAQGHEKIGPPRSPDHLLRPGELIEAVQGELTIVAYEHGGVPLPRPAIVERICAIRAGLSHLPGAILPSHVVPEE